jgi:hypothetical protein
MHGNLVHLLVLFNGLSAFNRPQDIQNNASNTVSSANNNNNGNIKNAPIIPNAVTNSQPQGNNTNTNNAQQRSSPPPSPSQNNTKSNGPPQVSPVNNKTSDHDYRYVNIKNIPDSVRSETCSNQVSFCDNVCGYLKSAAMINDCSSDTLRWKCECENNLFPSPDNYTFPAEYVICTEDLRSCELGCGSEMGCQSRCRDRRICAAKDVNDGKMPTVPTPKPKTYDIFNSANRSYYAESIVFISLISLFVI